MSEKSIRFTPPLKGKIVDEDYPVDFLVDIISAEGLNLSCSTPGNINNLSSGSTIIIDMPFGEKVELISSGITKKNKEGLYEIGIFDKKAYSDFIGRIRKIQHIVISETQNVEMSKDNGFSSYYFTPNALPEIDYDDLDTKANFLGRDFSLPIFITAMTGGVEGGGLINDRLAASAEKFNIPMGLGSQRIAIENEDLNRYFALKVKYPKLFLLGNIGGQQLLGDSGINIAKKAVELVGADALAIHLNVLQEMIQPEGDRSFKGILEAIKEVKKSLDVPLIVKEVGMGVSLDVARRLIDAGVDVIDVGGGGGTSWAKIEGLRSNDDVTKRLGDVFKDFSLSTAESLTQLEPLIKKNKIKITATGGIRTGLDVAKAVALGANMVGIGLPFMKKAIISQEELNKEIIFFKRGLEITMMATGSANLSELKYKIKRG